MIIKLNAADPAVRNNIRNFLLKRAAMNIYHLGDLDTFFLPRTSWFALTGREGISEIALLYKGGTTSTLLAFANESSERLADLVNGILNDLPEKFYAHLSCGLCRKIPGIKVEDDFGNHLKMELAGRPAQEHSETGRLRRLTGDDEAMLRKFYDEHYPGHYFDKRMLETGKFFGEFDNGVLAGAAGIHVYSPEQRVAALGNITVAASHRGMGICKKLTERLCADLLETVDVIGLNVHSENVSAIKCYESCGFEICGEYEEFLISRS